MLSRRVDLEGCLNFRDLGGYPTTDGRTVQWRLLFRADSLGQLTPKDVADLRDAVGLGEIIDLRSTREIEIDGRGLLQHEAINFHHLPLFDAGADGDETRLEPPQMLSLAEMYLGMTERASEPIGRVLSTIAGTQSPLVYHCAAGKDRTGVISALILGILGVEDDVIVLDYAATRENLDAIVARLNASGGYRDMWKELPPDTLHADPETMIELLDGIRERHGSMEGYARTVGLDDAAIASLRERLLE